MRKLSLIFVLLYIANMFANAQPKRIEDSDTYWELRGDTLFITGKGRMKYTGNKPMAWGSVKRQVKHAVIEEGVTFLSSSAFADCFQLTDVHLPQSLRSVGRSAFADDSNLRHCRFPEKLDSIGGSAFYHALTQDTLLLPEQVFYLGGSSFARSPVTHVEIPYKVDSLHGAFANTVSLVSVILPAGLRQMQTSFCKDSMLRLIVSLSVVPPTFYYPSDSWAHTFYLVKRSECRLIVPSSAVAAYGSTPMWKDFIIEGGGLSVGVCFNDKKKGYVHGLENRFYRIGEKVRLNAEPRGDCTFIGWKSNGQLISTSNPLTITVTKDTLLQACFEGEVSVKEAKKLPTTGNDIYLHPNPAQDGFRVHSPSVVNKITLYDLSGRCLLQVENNTCVNIASLSKGVYIVELQTATGRFVKKLVKQ